MPFLLIKFLNFVIKSMPQKSCLASAFSKVKLNRQRHDSQSRARAHTYADKKLKKLWKLWNPQEKEVWFVYSFAIALCSWHFGRIFDKPGLSWNVKKITSKKFWISSKVKQSKTTNFTVSHLYVNFRILGGHSITGFIF